MSSRVYQEVDDITDRWDYTSTASYWYHGHASPGSAETSPVWRIKRFQLDATNRIIATTFPGGNANYNNQWSERTSLVYS